ncbi:hypothetical protein [Saccharopolyspora sp. NPDC002376]
MLGALRQDVAAQHGGVRAGDREDELVEHRLDLPHPPHPRHRVAVGEPHHPAHLDVDLAGDALHGPHQARLGEVVLLVRRHAVDQPQHAVFGVEVGLQDQGVVPVLKTVRLQPR